ncbi:hypothetical protein [Thermoactinomyces mirandus]|uniref:Uncharacterized protein n=1 Tax=Thermoactinomyces mirandus TaxID=2756294 RepID=A0A7W1XRB8_9BACL|nr:hypothetical protein [Thermoactinomyces mirandus]MBA4601691.1 hypothetical protein [Thermoactinomyces mirandus]
MELLRKHGGKLILAYLLGFLLLSVLISILLTENIILLFMKVPLLSVLLVLAFYLLYYGGATEITISALYRDDSSIRHFFNGSYRNLWKLLKIHFFIFIIAVIPVILIYSMISRGTVSENTLFVIFDMIFSLFFYLFLTYLSFFGSVLVIKDQLKAWPAIKKAFVSLKKNFGKISVALLYTAGTQLFLAISLTGMILIIFMLFNLDQLGNEDLIVPLTYLGGLIFRTVFSFAVVCSLPVFVKKYKDTIELHLS